jgi:hypothetical protein
MRNSMSKYTPGPWTVEEYGDDETPALVIHKDTESRVCFMATPGSHGDPETIEADARLIVAAPDLLAAAVTLEEAEMNRQFCDECNGEGEPEACGKCFPKFDAARVMRRDAIGKATGKTVAIPTPESKDV